jgi:hypothetical protein
VTSRTKTILGVRCVEVRDTVKIDGALKEDTLDWYAQHRDGTVWYFGEDTKEYEKGKVSSTTGTWMAGVRGALPGSSCRPSRAWATATGRSTTAARPRTWQS